MYLSIYQLNAYFSLLFMSWCIGLLLGIPYFGLKEYTAPTWVFYAAVFVALLFNYIISTYRTQQKHISFLISGIIGFTVFTAAHFGVSCYYLGHMKYYDPDHREMAQGLLFCIIPTIANGIFGILLTSLLYCQRRYSIKIWKDYPLITCYSVAAILMCTYILNFVYTTDGGFKRELIVAHTSIIVAAAFIIVAFVTFIRQLYYGGIVALFIAGIMYGNLAFKMIYYMIDSYNRGYPKEIKKCYALFMHCYAILIFVITGIYICYHLGKRLGSKEKISKTIPKISVDVEEVFPSTLLTQKY